MKNKANTNKELAEMIVDVAGKVNCDAIICLTEKGKFVRELDKLDPPVRVVTATADSKTYEDLVQSDMETIRMPIHGIDKYRQIPHLLSVALKAGSISVGDFVLAAIGKEVYPDKGNLFVLAEAERELEELSVKDLLSLTDGIRPAVLDAVMELARKIGLVARRKKRIGAIFTIGDSKEVLKYSKQLVPNPLQGHDEEDRRITDPRIHDSIIELAKLDGAFVIRGDGLIQTAGTFLNTGTNENREELQRKREELELPEGLGTRHVAAATTTARTEATAVVVSETDGNIRVFAGGEMVLKMDPSMDYGQIEK